jgi:hypothetical protein
MRNTLRPGSSQRGLLCNGMSGFLFRCLPWFAFAIDWVVSPVWRTVLWTASLGVMGHCVCSTLPDAAASTAASLARFSSLVLLLPLDTVLDFCRLDRPDGNGFAP